MLKVYASCFSITVVMGTRGAHLLKGIYNLKDQKKCQHFSLLMFFVSLLCCEFKISGGVSYDQFINVIFRKLFISQVKLVTWIIEFQLDYVPSAADVWIFFLFCIFSGSFSVSVCLYNI